MATREQLYTAIRNADKAGDAEAVRKLGAALKAMDQRPMPPTDTNPVRGFVLGAMKPLDKAATLLESGFNAITGANSQSAATAAAENTAARAANTRTGFQTAGSIGATALLPGGPIVQGATGGALLSDSDTAAGMAKDAAIGAAGGYLGDKVVRGVAGVVGPRVAPALAKLQAEGVRVTPGQAARASGNRVAAAAEDRATTLPILGGRIEAGREAANEGFNRAIVNRALKPIGIKLPDNIPVGHDAIKYAGDQLSRVYQDVLPRLSGKLDRTFKTRLDYIRASGDLPPAYAAELENVKQSVLREAFDTSGRYNGKAFQRVSDRLDKVAANWSKSADDPWKRELGASIYKMREELHALARRQNPTLAAKLRAADNGWASLVRAERAAAQTADGVVSPNQYSQAVRIADRSARKRAVARGEARDQDLAKAAATVLPSGTGSSGTAERLANNSGTSWALGAALSPLYAAAQRATPLVTRQASPTAMRLGDLIRRSAPAGTAAGSAGTVYLAN